MRKEEIRWYNIVEIVDVETGEIITKSQFERRNLRIINKTKNHEFSERNGIKFGLTKIRWEVREHEQTRMFD